MFIAANVAITAVKAIKAMMTILTTAIMTNTSKIAIMKPSHALWSSAIIAIRIIMEITGNADSMANGYYRSYG